MAGVAEVKTVWSVERDGESHCHFGGNVVPKTEKNQLRRNDLVCTSLAPAWEEEVVEVVEAVPVSRVESEPEGLEPNKG